MRWDESQRAWAAVSFVIFVILADLAAVILVNVL